MPPEDDYVVSGGVLTEYKGSGGSVTVPSKIGSSVVTAIGRGAFSGNTSLRSVSLPVGVKNIGQEAFADCTALTSVSLPSTLESVGAGAFYGCDGVTVKCSKDSAAYEYAVANGINVST